MTISILIPCHNEEKSIRTCVQSCLDQTRKPDQILVVNDGSTDRSGEILAEFGDAITVITIPKATGNKSYAQEHGLKFITGDIFIATDGDTKVDKNFVAQIEKDFQDPKVMAVGGYVKSLKYNWLTACRALEYTVGQNIHKLAQSYINYMFVIPGAAGAFRTKEFKEHVNFEHDTLTEDLDFTYKFHKKGLRILYDRKAITYTQDPTELSQYINQTRRWVGGGMQNLLKHFRVIEEPARALELSLIYIEGLVFSLLLLVLPFINLYLSFIFFASYIAVLIVLAVWASIKEKRADILLVPFLSVPLIFINAWIFVEQFTKEILLRKKNLVWFHPERVKI